jgi:glucan 1,3-beta-glucosidase
MTVHKRRLIDFYFSLIGDGVTDDTAAIQAAIADGGRCGQNCISTTTLPAVVYFPAGTYIVKKPIFDYYYTQMIGNANNPPTIKADSSFSGGYVIDGDPYFTANQNWGSTNVFYRQFRNFVIDTTAVPAGQGISGMHWPTAQATSIQFVTFKMAAGASSQHTGLFIENG